MSALSLHLIAHADAHFLGEPDYVRLDNRANPRPDWREYWVIRAWMQNHVLQDEHWYGFFSPRFADKTGLSYHAVQDFVASAPAGTDAVIFSPQVEIGAFFRNALDAEELADPGFLSTCARFAAWCGLPGSVTESLMDSRDIVFSNYIVARGRFWRLWQGLAEQVWQLAEHGEGDAQLVAALRQPTAYKEGVPRKVFLVERLASLVFASHPALKVVAYNPFRLAHAAQLVEFGDEAVLCDALKIAYRTQAWPEYLALFERTRQHVLQAALGRELLGTLRQVPGSSAAALQLLPLLKNRPNRLFVLGRVTPELAAACELRFPGLALEACEAQVAECDVRLRALPAGSVVLVAQLPPELPLPQLLERLGRTLPAATALILAIPHARHWRSLARLARGEWPWPEGGALTRTDLEALLARHSLRVENGIREVDAPADAERYLTPLRTLARASGGQGDELDEDARIARFLLCLRRAA